MYLRRSLASLARQLHVYDLFLCRYIWGLAPSPPPHTKKLATLLLAAFAQEWPKLRWPIPSPPLATRNRRHCSAPYRYNNS